MRFRLPLPVTFALTLPVTASATFAQCETQQLGHANPDDVDVFGWCVDVEGDVAALGTIGDDNACPGDPSCNSGALHVFRRVGGTWSEDQVLRPADNAFEDEFGHDVEISGDRLIVGAHKKGEGRAYVFRDVNGVFVEEQTLFGTGIQNGFHFGHSVALEGTTALVGTMRDDHAGTQAGSAFVFDLVGGVWTESEKLTASDAGPDALFGRSCDLSGDVVVLGSHAHDTVAGVDAGAAYVYTRTDPGTPGDPIDDTWPETPLAPNDPLPGGFFGRSVGVDGDTVVVGAVFAETGGVATGAVYVFERTGSAWNQVDKLLASDGEAGDEFGMSVRLQGDRLLVGARNEDGAGTDAGAVYVFAHDGTGWVETAKLTGSTTLANDRLGEETSVAVSGDTAIVTARFHGGGGVLHGAAYVFDLTDCLGTSFCPAVPNSTGQIGRLTVSGSQAVVDDDITLTASDLPPGEFGMFLASRDTGLTPLGGFTGILCLDGDVGRFDEPGEIGTGPVWSIPLDLSAIPVNPMAPVLPGDTWNFQFWHRDVGNDTNMTDAVAVAFH